MIRSGILAFVCLLATADTLCAQGAAVREAGEVVLRSLSSYFGKASAKEVGEQLAEYGGEAAVRQLAQKAAAEGGQESVERIAALAGKHGPETIRGLGQADQVVPVLKSLGELPEESIDIAIRRLAADSAERQLSKNIAAFGTRALKTEIQHPGVGTALVRDLGDDGIRAAEKLTTNEAIQLARHSSDIAKLPADQKTGILNLIHQDAKSMVAFMGRFIENNPGKTLFAAGTTAVILAEPDRILGGDEIIFDENGIPHLVSKPGLAGRTIDAASRGIVMPLMKWIAPIVALAVGGWLGIKLWSAYRHSKSAVDRLKARHD